MRFSDRPALRTQWFSILLALALTGAGAALLLLLAFTGPRAEYQWGGVSALGLGGVLWLLILYRHYEWRYSVDNGVIESRRGIIGREVRSIRVEDLRNVNVRQSFFQRLFRLGDVEFSSAGGEGVEVAFSGVSHPMRLKSLVQALQDRDEAGNHGD